MPKVGTPRSSPRGGYIQLYYATMTTVKLKIKLADYQLVDTLHQSWSVAVTVAKVSLEWLMVGITFLPKMRRNFRSVQRSFDDVSHCNYAESTFLQIITYSLVFQTLGYKPAFHTVALLSVPGLA